jgi:metal-responsive CopG/Arc/MetJ family transcriptional regulator
MKDRPVTIRLTPLLIKEIDDLAKIEKRSRNNMLQIIIETYFLKTKKHDN